MEATVTNVLSLTLAILSVWPATMWIDRALQAEAAAALCDREIPLVRGPTSNLPPPMLKLAGFEVPCTAMLKGLRTLRKFSDRSHHGCST